jgi:hypothetical protein
LTRSGSVFGGEVHAAGASAHISSVVSASRFPAAAADALRARLNGEAGSRVGFIGVSLHAFEASIVAMAVT